MSTKTTFKRIALVAVAALGLSLVAVAPSNAGEGSFRVITFETAPATATTGVAVTAVVKVTGVCNLTNGINNITTTVFIAAIPGTSSKAPNNVNTSNYTGTTLTSVNATTAAYAGSGSTQPNWQDGATLTGAGTNGRCTGYYNATFTPDVVGSYTIVAAPSDGAANISPATWTVVASAPVVQSMKAYLNTDTTTATTADASSLSYAAASSVTAKGAFFVQQYSTTDTATTATTAIAQAVTVTISKGLVSKTNDYFAGAKSVSTAAGATNGRSEYYVFANGEVGSATLTVTVGALTSTKTITFQGVAATLSAALTAGQPTFIAPLGTTTVTVTAKDSAGNAAIALPTMTVTSATTTVATATIASGVVTITGVAAGTSVITIADSATTAPATSATYTVTVAPAASVAAFAASIASAAASTAA